MAELSVLVVGRIQELPEPVGEAPGSVRVARLDDLQAATRYLASAAQPPEVVVIAQSRPGQFGDTAIDALRREAPLARVWRLLGSWCEGETRSGRPPSGCLSTYWHQWPPRWARDLALLKSGASPTWALPVTASADEHALAAAARPMEPRAGAIAICARHAQTAAALADACRLGGYTPRVAREGRAGRATDALAVLWDADVERLRNPAAIKSVRTCAGPAPLLALVNFPRAEDCRLAADAGVAAVISKPFQISDLLWHLARAVA